VLAAETVGPDSLAELASLGTEAPILLLAPVRAAAVLRRPVEQDAAAVAVRLPPSLLASDALHGLADPTIPQAKARQPLEPAETPPAAHAALNLAKLGRAVDPGLREGELLVSFGPWRQTEIVADGRSGYVEPEAEGM